MGELVKGRSARGPIAAGGVVLDPDIPIDMCAGIVEEHGGLVPSWIRGCAWKMMRCAALEVDVSRGITDSPGMMVIHPMHWIVRIASLIRYSLEGTIVCPSRKPSLPFRQLGESLGIWGDSHQPLSRNDQARVPVAVHERNLKANDRIRSPPAVPGPGLGCAPR
jgi:hypothetical protein